MEGGWTSSSSPAPHSSSFCEVAKGREVIQGRWPEGAGDRKPGTWGQDVASFAGLTTPKYCHGIFLHVKPLSKSYTHTF